MNVETLFHKLRTASSLTPGEWKVLIWAYGFLLKIRLLLLFFPLRLVEKALIRDVRPSTHQTTSYSQRELLNLFHIAWRYQWKKPNCLPTSLAQQLFLARYGFPVNFRIGVRKKKGAFQAHAWCSSKSAEPPPKNFHPLKPLVEP